MSLALLLKLLLLGEIAAELAIGAGLRHWLGGPPWVVIAIAAALWLGGRVATLGTEFRLARRWGDPVPQPLRIGRARLAACIAVEMLAWLRCFTLAQPFPLLSAPWSFLPAQRGTRPVVLLVHGLVCNGAVWRSMRRRLVAEGFDVEVVNLRPLFGPIAMTVPLLDDRIEAICRARGIERIAVVAHSMGGLAIRAYLAAQGDARIARVVTLGTPHLGTRLAELGRTRNVREMRCGSGFLAALAAKEKPARAGRFTCIYSYHDNLVAPQRNAVLPGARAVAFSGIGHMRLVEDAAVQQQVVVELRRAAERPKAAPVAVTQGK